MSSTEIVSWSQLDITWGCFFISVPLTSALWGIGCLHLYQYYEKYWKTDQRWFRLYIFLIWALDTAHQVLVVYSGYIYFVKGILDRETLITLPATIIPMSALACLIDVMIQAILVRRVWYLSGGNRILTGLLSAAVTAEFIISTVGSVKIFKYATFIDLYEDLPFELAFACVAMVVDTFLAIVLVWLLWRARSGLRSDSIVSRLVAYIIGTSLLTVVCMAISTVASVAAPRSFIDKTADTIVPKLYFNCMLASLNVRTDLRKDLVVSASYIIFRITGSSRSQCPADISEHISSSVCNTVDVIDIEAGQLAQKERDETRSVTGAVHSDNAVP